jgi:hypothetical protein
MGREANWQGISPFLAIDPGIMPLGDRQEKMIK